MPVVVDKRLDPIADYDESYSSSCESSSSSEMDIPELDSNNVDDVDSGCLVPSPPPPLPTTPPPVISLSCKLQDYLFSPKVEQVEERPKPDNSRQPRPFSINLPPLRALATLREQQSDIKTWVGRKFSLPLQPFTHTRSTRAASLTAIDSGSLFPTNCKSQM